MKKKYLAFCIADLKYLPQTITGNKFLLEKICESFDKLFIINTENLRFLKQKNNSYNKRDFFINKKNSKFIKPCKYIIFFYKKRFTLKITSIRYLNLFNIKVFK